MNSVRRNSPESVAPFTVVSYCERRLFRLYGELELLSLDALPARAEHGEQLADRASPRFRTTQLHGGHQRRSSRWPGLGWATVDLPGTQGYRSSNELARSDWMMRALSVDIVPAAPTHTHRPPAGYTGREQTSTAWQSCVTASISWMSESMDVSGPPGRDLRRTRETSASTTSQQPKSARALNHGFKLTWGC
jgi:hypothetical protein